MALRFNINPCFLHIDRPKVIYPSNPGDKRIDVPTGDLRHVKNDRHFELRASSSSCWYFPICTQLTPQECSRYKRDDRNERYSIWNRGVKKIVGLKRKRFKSLLESLVTFQRRIEPWANSGERDSLFTTCGRTIPNSVFPSPKLHISLAPMHHHFHLPHPPCFG